MSSLAIEEKIFILQIVVNRPLRKQYDYSYISQSTPMPGSRVRLSFGSSETIGVITKVKDSSPVKRLKSIIKLIDKKPILDDQHLAFLKWTSDYYHYPLGEVIFNALPSFLRKGKPLPVTGYWQSLIPLNDETSAPLKRAKKQLALWRHIHDATSVVTTLSLTQAYGKTNWKALAKILSDEGYIRYVEENARRVPLPAQFNDQLELTDEQTQCIADISSICQAEKPKPILLHGITGSGKTEIYLRIIAPLISQNRQVLVIVPEIGLTPQLLSRFQRFFVNANIMMLHSALADGERCQAWADAQSGYADIIIGTRSAVFTPLPKLAMIIIDEEHDQSLKQQEGFRYHARDLAAKRAYDQGIPIILGSATPALESIQNTEKKNYHYLRLSRRPGSSTPPTTQVLDIKGQTLVSGLSNLMTEHIAQHLEAGSQVMLFLNRRGFAPALYCPSCGWHADCPSCDAKLTYHALSQKLRCHHCFYEQMVLNHCPDCGNQDITTRGSGTERLEHHLTSTFPQYPVIRIDRDTTSRKGSLQTKLDFINSGKPMIIIGTQMLAKGHDFANLTLVGILDIDQSLFSSDFRAIEYLAQLIVQVSGRAGRADKQGTVLMQTCQPDHPVFATLLAKGYMALAHELLEERRNWQFPPFSQQALIRANSATKVKAHDLLEQLKTALIPFQSSEVMLLGPAPSPMEKRANRYRSQLLLTATTRGQRHYLLQQMLEVASKVKTSSVQWNIDVDPITYD